MLKTLEPESVHCVVTSPPYWGLRDYGTGRWEGGEADCEHRSPTMREGRNEERAKLRGSEATNSAQLLLAQKSACGKCGAIKIDEQLGLEPTVAEHVAAMVEVFREVRRVMRKDGTVFLNYGDSYATSVNGRSNAVTKALGVDDRTFRDKPFSTIGPISGERHGLSYGNVDTAESGCPDRGLSSQNRDDGRTEILSSHTLGTDFYRALALSREPLRQILANISALTDPLPSGDYLNQQALMRFSCAILDQAPAAIRAVETVHDALASTMQQSSQQRQANCHLSHMISACLSSLRSYELCAQRIARMLAAISETNDCTVDIALLCEELKHYTQCTVSCCSLLASLEELKPQRTTGPVLKAKDLVGMPWRVALALQEDGWWLRQDIIWSKPNPMPESITDRCTKAHEYLFLLAKSERYYFDQEAISEPLAAASIERLSQPTLEAQYGSDRVPGKTNGPMKAVARGLGRKGIGTADEIRSSAGARMGRGAGWRSDPTTTPTTRNKRSVWEVATQPFSDAHFATFPPELIEPCIKAGCPLGGMVLDPFFGAGTTGLVADRLGRNCIGIELNPAYAEMARKRIEDDGPLFAKVAAE